MNIKYWNRLPYVVWLVFAIYIDSYCFVFATAVLQLAFGVNSAYSVCSGAILLCLACYITSKYIIRGSTKPRLKSKLYCFNCFVMLVIYVAVAILNFVFRITYIEDGVCVIGMQDVAMVPLISFDAVVNVYLTVMFLFPLKPTVAPNERLPSYAYVLLPPAPSSELNLTVLMALSGEPGWICLICCNSDILFSALVIQWVTSKDNAGTSDSANHPNYSADPQTGDPDDHSLSYINKSSGLRSRSGRLSGFQHQHEHGDPAGASAPRASVDDHSGPYSGHSCPNSHSATARAATIDNTSLSSDESDIKYPATRHHLRHTGLQATIASGAVVVTTTIQRESKPTSAFFEGTDNERLLGGPVYGGRNDRFERPGSLAVGSGTNTSAAVIASTVATGDKDMQLQEIKPGV
ncbi:hypothetical protein BROUX41_005170 [Berkeleyomyces rouxiae]|uniref:uncharacterized protein n=1 Tax=Berkeleyomyces rouxiae TaxID=2035830 RepID=UPI003B79A3A2